MKTVHQEIKKVMKFWTAVAYNLTMVITQMSNPWQGIIHLSQMLVEM